MARAKWVASRRNDDIGEQLQVERWGKSVNFRRGIARFASAENARKVVQKYHGRQKSDRGTEGACTQLNANPIA